MLTKRHSLKLIGDELATVRAAQQGEIGAFTQLVTQYDPMLRSVARRILHNEDDAIDATQIALLKAYRSLHRFYLGNFRGWLVRIVVSVSYDLLRLRKHHADLSLEVERESVEEGEFTPVDANELPEAYVERDELNQFICAGINNLCSQQRNVLVLHDVQGYSYEEIAQILEWPLGTVKSRLSRARAKVRTYLLCRPDMLPHSLQRYALEQPHLPHPHQHPRASPAHAILATRTAEHSIV